MANENCLIGSSGYGSVSVNVETVEYGLDILANEAHARVNKAFYMTGRTTNDFELGFVFASFEQIEVFAKWMRGYYEKRQNPDLAIGAMRVIIPARKFDQVGVPASRVPFGDELDALARRMTISFLGAKSPIATVLASQFVSPSLFTNEGAYFYPSDQQLGGEGTGLDYLFDQVAKADADYLREHPSLPPTKPKPTKEIVGD